MSLARKIACTLLVLITVLAFQACTNKFKVELEGKGISYTPDAFVDAVKNRNGDVVLLFVNSGFNVNACKTAKTPSGENENAMYWAIWNNDMQTAKLLLVHGYKLNKEKCRMKTPPLHLAAMRGLVDMADLLIENGADVNRTDMFGMTPLMLALQMRRPDMEAFLKSKGAK